MNSRAASPGIEEMTMLEHLSELRRRFLKCLAALAVCTGLCWGFIDAIVAFLTAPTVNLYYMRPAEAFFIYLKVALVAGTLLAVPMIVLYEGSRVFIKYVLQK